MIVLQYQNHETLLYQTNLGHISHPCDVLLSAGFEIQHLNIFNVYPQTIQIIVTDILV